MADKLRARLSGSRFRFLNQKLYESSSHEALGYFKEHQDDFLRYHEGFQEQTLRWPTNPVDLFIGRLLARPAGRPLVVADLGCGEGRLALEVHRQRGADIRVHSYDLVALADHIQVASMTDVPLPSGSVDLVVFSLSLMNTDLGEALREASRILRPSGEVWVAEVESRFDGGRKGVEAWAGQLRALGLQLRGKVDTSHRVFVLVDLVKRGPPAAAPSGLRSLALKPCKYKKR